MVKQEDLDTGALLTQAAAAQGIEPDYIDIWGRHHATSPETAGAILTALGFPSDPPQALAQSLNAHDFDQWNRPFDPVVVIRENADSIPLRIPASRSGASVKLEIRWENGDLEHHWFWLPELRMLEQRTVETGETSAAFISKRLPLPGSLRLGYHQIKIYWMKDPEQEEFGTARFIVCPLKAHAPQERAVGIGMSLYQMCIRDSISSP